MLAVSHFLIFVICTAGVYLLVTQKSIIARRYDFLDDPVTLVSLSFLSLFPWGLGGLGSERLKFPRRFWPFMPPDESCFFSVYNLDTVPTEFIPCKSNKQLDNLHYQSIVEN